MIRSRLLLKLKYKSGELPDNLEDAKYYVDSVKSHIKNLESADYVEIVKGAKEKGLVWLKDYLVKLENNYAELEFLWELQK